MNDMKPPASPLTQPQEISANTLRPPPIDYAVADRTPGLRFNNVTRYAMSGCIIAAGFVLGYCGRHDYFRDRRLNEIAEAGSIAVVLIGIFLFFAERKPRKERIGWFLNLQMFLATAWCVWSAMWLTAEPDVADIFSLIAINHWDRIPFRPLLYFAAGLTWFAIVRIVIRRRSRRMAAEASTVVSPSEQHRQRKRVWLLAASTAAIVFAFPTYFYVETVINRWLDVRDLSAYTAPADRVVYTDDPAEAERLLSAPDTMYYQDTGYGLRSNESKFVAARYRSLRAREYPFYLSEVVFVHERYPEKSDEPLIASMTVTASFDSRVSLAREIGFYAETIKPRVFSRQSWEGSRSVLKLNLSPADVLRIFAGQPDANDRSRFTIRYELNGEPGTIDGQLIAEGNVRLSVRDGPAMSREMK